jgi:tRNA A-37 threonylcarbamoyl transferase component Bud32
MPFEQIGKYKVVSKIGQGAMGEVYKAHDAVLNRFVAIKTITGTLCSDEQFRKRFHREAQSAAQLNHRNIVTVFEFAEERGMIYMVMELLEGTDLKELIAKKTLRRLEDKLAIIEQMCDGLAYAHERGVVHRDLKPANVHVLANGTIKIMDFGLARLGESEITRTGTVMGTPNYMSPEQVRGEKVDSRSDIFSIGAVMYEVLAGQRAFEAESMHSVLFQVLDKQPAPLRESAPHIPLPVAQVVEKALAKEPQRRYQSAGEMRADLRTARKAMGPSRAGSGVFQGSGISPPTGEATYIIANSSPDHATAPAATFLPEDRRRGASWPVTGATALARSPVVEAETPSTARPEPTILEMPEEVEEPPSKAPWVVGGALVLAIAAAAGAWWWRARAPLAPAAPAAEVANQEEGALRRQLVAGQVELAQADLDNKNYAGALSQAERVLALDPDNAEAKAIRQRAQATLDELEVAAQEARGAFGRGDADGASRALRRVMAIDPGHPAADELKAALNQHFRAQAEEARATMQSARAGAERARARGAVEFAAAERQTAAAEALFRSGQFAEATQKFLESGDAYARARRAAEAAAIAAQRAAASPSASPVRVVASPTVAVVVPSPTAPPTLPANLATPLPSPTVAAAPVAPASVPAAPAVRAEAAIKRVMADYVRAVEAKDVGLFKSVWPGISPAQERSLRESFKVVKSQQVNLSVDSIEVRGTTATVRITRQDTVNGQKGQTRQQTFNLSERGGAWTIESIGP